MTERILSLGKRPWVKRFALIAAGGLITPLLILQFSVTVRTALIDDMVTQPMFDSERISAWYEGIIREELQRCKTPPSDTIDVQTPIVIPMISSREELWRAVHRQKVDEFARRVGAVSVIRIRASSHIRSQVSQDINRTTDDQFGIALRLSGLSNEALRSAICGFYFRNSDR
jgi:hypothetical protein